MGINNKILKRIKQCQIKRAKIPSRRDKAEGKGQQYAVENFNRQEAEYKAEIPVLQAIGKVQLGDPKLTGKERETLFENYNYAKNSRNKIREGLYKAEKQKEKLKIKSKKAADKLIDLQEDEDDKPKKIIKKKEEIAHIGRREKHHDRRIKDGNINYEFSQKLISDAGKDPQKIRVLKKRTKQLNNAINKQKKLQKKFEKHEKASLNAKLLLDKKGKTTPDTSKRPQDITDKDTRLYVKHERRSEDLQVDYEFSGKILEKASKVGKTSGLKKEFNSLNTATRERNGYRTSLERAEKRKLKSSNALASLEKKMSKITSIDPHLRTEKDEKALADYEKKKRQLEQESAKQERRANDHSKLHDFSNKLIKNASATSSALALPKQFEDLKVAATRQKKIRNKLENVEKRILKEQEFGIANTGKLTPADQQRHALRTTQLDREQEDVKQGHDMMNDLIDVAYQKGDPSALPRQCKQLREGLGGKRRFTRRPFGQERNRLNLEKAENKHLEITLKKEKNGAALNSLKETISKDKDDFKNLSTLPNHELNENLQNEKSENSLREISSKDIKRLKDLTLKDEQLTVAETQKERRTKDAESDHVLGKGFLDKAQTNKDPSALPRQFARMEAAVKERDKFTKSLEKEENKQLEKRNKILSEDFKLTQIKRDRLVENEKLEKINHNDPKYLEQKTTVANLNNLERYQKFKLTKLRRIEEENKERDAKRLENATKAHKDANEILARILDPNNTEMDRKAAKAEFKKLKADVKEKKDKEKELSPPAMLKERATYRKRLEAAEERQLENLKKKELLEIEKLKAEQLRDADQKERALLECEKKGKRLDLESTRIDRRIEDTELSYNFANKLILESAKDTSGNKAKNLPQQFKELKAADKYQRGVRSQLDSVEKNLLKTEEKLSKGKLSDSNKEKYKLKAEQLTRQKEDLALGHDMTRDLMKAAQAKGDPTGLAQQTRDLREGIGGVRTFTRRVFGQEKNRQTLENHENQALKINRALRKHQKELSEIKDLAKLVPEKQEALNYKTNKLELAQKHSDRRIADAKNDHTYGKELLQIAKANAPEGLKNLKNQFSVMAAAIKERNKFTKNLEKIEKQAIKNRHKERKAILKAKKKKESIEKSIQKANEKLAELKKVPNEESEQQKEKREKAIAKQEERVNKLKQKLESQEEKIKSLITQSKENEENDKARIQEAKDFHQKANTKLQEIHEKNKTNTLDPKSVKDQFTELKAERKEKMENQKKKEKNLKEQRKKELKETKLPEPKIEVAPVIKESTTPETLPKVDVMTPPQSVTTSVDQKPQVSNTIQTSVNEPSQPQAAIQPTTKPPIDQKLQDTQVVVNQQLASAKQPVQPIPTKPIAAKAIRVECSVHTSKIATAQAKERANKLGYTLEEKSNGSFEVKTSKGMLLGTISLSAITNEGRSMSAISKPTNSLDENKQFFDVVSTFATQDRFDQKGKVHEPNPIVTLGGSVEKPDEIKQEIEKLFKEKYEERRIEHRRTLRGVAKPPTLNPNVEEQQGPAVRQRSGTI